MYNEIKHLQGCAEVLVESVGKGEILILDIGFQGSQYDSTCVISAQFSSISLNIFLKWTNTFIFI